MSLYGSAVKRPIMTTLCFVAVVILGLFSLRSLPIDLYPDIETNTLMVMTTYSGASAQDIEQNVTRPLENVLNSVSNLKHITSKSRENISVITLEFEYGEDIDVLTNDVRDKLDMVSSMLPDDSETPIIFKFSTDMIPIIMLSVKADESMPGLYKILDDAVANPLARISGVGSVSISGAPKREIHIYTDPSRLEAYNLSIEQIGAIIGAENRNIPGGSFDIGSDTYSLRVQGEFKSSDEMANIVVGSYQGRNIYLRDVARIDDTLEERAQETLQRRRAGRHDCNPEAERRKLRADFRQGAQNAAYAAETPAFRRETRHHRRHLRQYPQHHRLARRNGDVRTPVRDYRGVLLPRTMARHTHHHNHDSYIAHCIVHIPLRHGQHAQYRVAVGTVDIYRHGGRRRHRGA